MTCVVYGFTGSGNCYKVELVLTQLGRAYRWQEIDILRGESRNDKFLAINPNGKVPALELPGGEVVTESNAILCHLAENTGLLPEPGLQRTRVLEWLFFEQYDHEPNIAVLRAERQFGRYQLSNERREHCMRGGYHALDVMERWLRGKRFLAGESYTIADIALFAYTHVAEQGGFKLDSFPAVNRWLDAVRETEKFIPMPDRH